MKQLKASTIKIVWGYIKRLILWSFLSAFALAMLINMIIPALTQINNSSSQEEIILYYKIDIVCTNIMNLIVTVLACKFATSGIQNRFIINKDNKSKVFKGIVIIIIILTVMYVVFSLIYIFKEQKVSTNLAKLVDKQLLEDYFKFSKIVSITFVIVNSIVMLLMIPYEKKLLLIEPENPKKNGKRKLWIDHLIKRK